MKKIILLLGFCFFIEITSFAIETSVVQDFFRSDRSDISEQSVKKKKQGWDSNVKKKRKKKLKRRRGRTVYGGTSKYSKRYNPFDIN